ncbi:MAG: hypothetical protein WA637_23715, partial [Terriglobales bacterium]
RILYAILAISFSLSISFLIFFKLELERDWLLVLLLLISFVSGVLGFGVLIDSFLEGGELVNYVSQVGYDYLCNRASFLIEVVHENVRQVSG